MERGGRVGWRDRQQKGGGGAGEPSHRRTSVCPAAPSACTSMTRKVSHSFHSPALGSQAPPPGSTSAPSLWRAAAASRLPPRRHRWSPKTPRQCRQLKLPHGDMTTWPSSRIRAHVRQLHHLSGDASFLSSRWHFSDKQKFLLSLWLPAFLQHLSSSSWQF